MIGKRKVQSSLFDVGNVWSFAPDPKSFHGQLPVVSDELFVDDDLWALYSEHRGRPSTPPLLLALMLMMQSFEGISDEEVACAVPATCVGLRSFGVLWGNPCVPRAHYRYTTLIRCCMNRISCSCSAA